MSHTKPWRSTRPKPDWTDIHRNPETLRFFVFDTKSNPIPFTPLDNTTKREDAIQSRLLRTENFLRGNSRKNRKSA